MKKLNLFFIIFIGLTFFSCSSDDDNGNQINVSGELIVNGQTFQLTKGFIVPNSDGSDPDLDPRRFYFILTNGDVSYANNEFTYSNNITQLIDFNMYTSVTGSGSVESTTYPIYDFNDPNFDFDDAFIDHSGVNTNVIIQNGSYVSSDALSSDDTDGEATISENNGIYTITFSYSNNQNTVTGAFTGTLNDLNE
ncbi:hypothetical protein ACW5R3_12005 [Bizionia sp. KMM 8389]